MMELNKYYVLEELLCLSQQVDDIIEKEISKMEIDDKCFEEAKSRIYEILSNKFSEKVTCQIYQHRNKNLKFEAEKTMSPLRDPRVRIHLKCKNKDLNTVYEDGKHMNIYTTKTKPSRFSSENNCNHILHIFNDNLYSDSNGNSIDQAEMKVLDENREKIELESGQNKTLINKMAKQLKLGDFIEEETKTLNTFSDNYTSVNINSINPRDNNMLLHANTGEILQKSLVLNSQNNQSELDNKQNKTRISCQNSQEYKQIDLSFPTKIRTKLHCRNKVSSSSDESRISSEKLTEFDDKKKISKAIFNETYTLNFNSSGDSNRDNKSSVSFETPVAEIINDTYTIDSTGNLEWDEYISNNVEEFVENEDEKEVRKIPVDLSVEEINLFCFCSPRTKGSSVLKNKKSCFACRNRNSSRESDTKQSPKNVFMNGEPSSITNSTSVNRYRLRSLSRKNSEDTIMNNRRDDLKLRKLVLKKQCKEKLLSGDKIFKPKVTFTVKAIAEQSEKLPSAPGKVEGEINENNFQSLNCEYSNKSIGNEEESIFSNFESKIQKKNLYEKYTLSSNANEKNESVINRNISRQCRTKSAPIPKRIKVNTNRNARPETPSEFSSNFNRQSLKVKADEKRKLREIRAQETKERRERLEIERKERIRLSEQRLKQRFQRHEEILKKKKEKFKIKSRSKQKGINKRSTESGSSEDGKENRTKDNDDLCRNSVGSGPNLSKESNGYHDVSFKKVDLAFLESKVGLYPEVSKIQNAILVSRAKTPAEISDSDSSANTKKSEEMVVGNYDRGSFEICATEPIEEIIKPSKNCTASKNMIPQRSTTKMIFSEKNTIFRRMQSKRKSITSTPNTVRKLMKYDHVRIFSTNASKNTVYTQRNNSYALLSPYKGSKRMHNGETKNSSDSMQCDMNVKNSEILTQKCSTRTILGYSTKESINCGKMCFNIKFSKSKKPDKNLVTPSNKSTNLYRENYMQTRSMKRLLRGSYEDDNTSKAEANNAVKKLKKKKGPTSYRISDFDEDSFDEEKIDKTKIPQWATGVYLKQALLQQYYKPPKSEEEIFGVLLKEPVDLSVIFSRDKPEYHKRTSSDEWSTTTTPP